MPILELRDITKVFPGVVANDRVSLSLDWGEIVALLGENGAGKSTLMNIAYGLLAPDGGEMLVDGRPVRIRSPRQAIALGIGMVHQHFMLVETLTVTENIVLGREPARAGVIDLRTARARVRETLRTLRPRGRSRRPHSRSLRRIAAARRDPEGALPGRPHPHPRRTDRRADSRRGERALRGHPFAGRQRAGSDVHHPQARRGPRRGGSRRGDARRQGGRRNAAGGDRRGGTGPDDGGTGSGAARGEDAGASRRAGAGRGGSQRPRRSQPRCGARRVVLDSRWRNRRPGRCGRQRPARAGRSDRGVASRDVGGDLASGARHHARRRTRRHRRRACRMFPRTGIAAASCSSSISPRT